MTRNQGYLRWATSFFSVALLLLLVYGCDQKKPLFNKVEAGDSGLDFVNSLETADSLSILDYLYFYNGGGLAIGDVNNDGLADIFFSSNLQSNQLFINKGGLEFENVSTAAGVEGKSSWNTGAVMAC